MGETMSCKNRILFFVFALLLTVTVFLYGASIALPTSSAAQADEVTAIESEEDLRALADRVNSGDNCLGETFSLSHNVDMGSEPFQPIGDSENHFHGTILGNGYTVIVNLVARNGYAGLIGTLGTSGAVRNLTIKGSVSGSIAVGSVVAYNRGTIENCMNYASVTGSGTTSNTFAGGLVGRNDSTGKILSCVNFGAVNAPYNAGGVCGQSSGTIDSCVNFGAVTATADSSLNVGGILGNDNGTVVDCYNAGEVIIKKSASRTGAVVGTSALASGVRNNYSVISGLLPACGSNPNTEGKYENKSLYDFLSDEGVTFSGTRYARATYACGYGYLYAPAFLLEGEETIAFRQADVEERFRRSLFEDGNGSQEDPFVIADENNWLLFGTNAALYDYDGKYLFVARDLNVGGAHSLGTEETPFAGTLNGNGNTISLQERGQNAHVALFAYTRNASFVDLKTSGTIIGGSYVAALVAYASGNLTLTNVGNYAAVTGDEFVGGLVGATAENGNLRLTGCINDARITCGGTKKGGRTGGLVGYAQGDLTVNACGNYGVVASTANGSTGIGGLIGEISASLSANASVRDSANEGDVSASGKADGVGGLIGKASVTGGSLEVNSVATVANVSGKTDVGGLIGLTNGAFVSYFCALGTVAGENHVAGIAATNGNLTLERGYFSGEITEVRNTLSPVEVFEADTGVYAYDGASVDVSETYYNEDRENKFDSSYVVRKNLIQMTEGSLFEDPSFSEIAPETDMGVFPYPMSIKNTLRKTDRLNVSYFSGVRDGYYLISDEQTLRNFAFLCNSSFYQTLQYALSNDVTLTKPFLDIAMFKGNWNGNGYKIRNLQKESGGTEIGLFSALEGATVSNVFLLGGEIVSSNDTARVGTIAGTADAHTTITSCFSTVTLSGASAMAGGLVGANYGTITECFFAGNMTGGMVSGGLAGENFGAIRDSFFTGKVTGSQRTGGVSADTEGTIERCYVNGRVDGGNGLVGGITANATNATITSCFVLADLVTTGNCYALFGGTTRALTDCFFNYDFIPKTAYAGVEQNANHAKDASFFAMTGAGNFAVPGYITLSSAYNDTFDAQYTRMLNAFGKYLSGGEKEDEDVAYYVKKSSELFVFDRDTASEYAAGTKNNPYLIGNAYQFKMLVPLTRLTDYYGKFFYITRDIDLGESALYNGDAIGFYSDAEGLAFRATMYGNPEDRPIVSGVYVYKAESGAGTIAREYVGVFANTESGFALKDLVFEGVVTANGTAGGLVGFTHGGEIINCLSMISVTSSESSAGGLVGAVSGSVTVRGCVVDAPVTAARNAYGLLGIGAGTSGVTVNATGSWFVTDGASAETYVHNNYGNVLYDYSDAGEGQRVLITQHREGFGFLTESGNAYKGYVMDFSNGLIAEAFETAYYPPDEDGSVMYCMRFCVGITVKAVTPSGTETDYASMTADGHYFVGERITAELFWTDEGKAIGYKFVGLKDKEGGTVPFTLEPSADSVIVAFVMTEDTTEVRFVIDKMSENGDILTFNVESGEEYDGNERAFTVRVENCEAEFYLSDGTSVGEIRNANEYRIVVRQKDSEDGNFIGTYERTYAVAKRTLTFGEAEAFAPFCTTTYNKDSKVRSYTTGVTADSEVFLGVLGGETVSVSFQTEYATIEVGEGIEILLKAATSSDPNYTFAITEKDLGDAGVIVRKTLALPLDYEKEEDGTYILERRYAGNRMPSVSGVYEISVTWTFEKDGVPVSSGFGVGDYRLIPQASEEDAQNYLLTTDKEYLLRILPYEVNTVELYETEFMYSRSPLNEEITRATYFTASEIDGFTHAVALRFYTDSTLREETAEVVHAGDYYLVATAVDPNYSLAKAEPRRIMVRKVTLAQAKITLKKEGTTLNGDGTETIRTEDKLYISFAEEDDVVTKGIEEEYVVRDVIVNSYVFQTAFDDEEDAWYIQPVASAEEVTFRIEFGGATDYFDRQTERTFTFSVQKMTLAVTLREDTFYYGDDVLGDYAFAYYYLNEDGSLGEEKSKEDIPGLEEANISFGVSVLRVGSYNVSYAGGTSNGYAFVFRTRSITILKKPIRIVLTSGIEKLYGEDDPEFPYTVAGLDENDVLRELTVLPDGRELGLQGKLGREKGEDATEYGFTPGTLTEASNTNYSIDYSGIETVRFTIVRRNLTITIKRNQGKTYGEADGAFEWETTNDTFFVTNDKLGIHDDSSILKDAFIITREEGENVGYYEYYVQRVAAKVNELNYFVTVLPSDGNYYGIKRVTPILGFRVIGTPMIGDKTNDLDRIVTVTDYKGDTIPGYFELFTYGPEGEEKDTFDKDDTRVYLRFTPTDGKNYSKATTSANIQVQKRVVGARIMVEEDLAEGTAFVYTASGVSTDVFNVVLTETIEGGSFTANVTIEGDAKNVSASGFIVKATITSDYYTVVEEIKATCYISKAMVTVKLMDGSLKEGETFTPTISYSGFVGGENKTVLVKQATVGNVPSIRGTYTLTPSGAEAKNYDFRYVSGIVTVFGKAVATKEVNVKGNISPEYTITTQTFAAGSDVFADTQADTDKSLGYGLLKPNAYKMTEYVAVRESMHEEKKEYEYTVKFASWGETDELCVRNLSGSSIQEVTAVEQAGDGFYVTFKSDSMVYGVARYEKKETPERIKGYWFIAALGGGGLVLLIVLIGIGVLVKRSKRPKQYAYTKGTYRRK